MKTALALIAFIATTLFAFADTRSGKLFLNLGQTESNVVEVAAGETAHILGSGGGYGRLEVLFTDINYEWKAMNVGNGAVSNPLEIPGPCNLRIKPNNPTATEKAFVLFKIESPSTSFVSGVVTLPALVGDSFSVTLEKSGDLSNWAAVAPGSFLGTPSLQFFRVRIEQP